MMHTVMSAPLQLRHLLLVRTDHLGDMLLTLPVAEALKRAAPACRVTVLASAANAEAARHHPAVDDVEVDPLEAKGSGLRGVGALARQLRRLECDAAIVAHPTPRLALAVWRAGIALRIGTAYRAYSFLFNRRVHQHRRRPPWRHESEYNVSLLAPLGLAPSAVPPPRWEVRPEEAAAVDALIEQRGLGTSPLIALHPGNAGSALNWSAAQYAELGRRLAAAGARLIITGGKADIALTRTVAAGIGAAALDLGGQVSLPALAALLSRCVLYIGSSTGPTHLAAALGVPVVALYSPLRSNAPTRWRPIGERVWVLQPAVDLVCPQCLGARCPYYHCMERHLTVDAAERAVRQMLGWGAGG
jgi:heptosyltransferase-3